MPPIISMSRPSNHQGARRGDALLYLGSAGRTISFLQPDNRANGILRPHRALRSVSSSRTALVFALSSASSLLTLPKDWI
jgi:hypothetical protein